MTVPAFILEINTRVWLRRLGGGTPLPLDQVDDSHLDTWKNQGFDAIWLMGVWHSSDKGAEIARSHEGLQREYLSALPDLRAEDITGSPYAIADYKVHADLGGNTALASFRERLKARGLKLILDFVPNHTAIDHKWVFEHPEWYVQGNTGDENNYIGFQVESDNGPRVLCHGKDPYFPPWTDTAQLDYRNPGLQEALRDLLKQLALICDGVRCDMAMLVLSDVFEKTWGSRPAEEFWPRAIREARTANPEFLFMAEVYWDKDKDLLDMGFNLTYDKVPLDHAVHGPLWDRHLFDLPVEEHRRRVRFLENHDEPRIASLSDSKREFAAAGWLFSLPTTRLIYQGQLEGAKVRPPVQLLRAPEESVNESVSEFYNKLFACLKTPVVRTGNWSLLETRSAWQGNESNHRILGQGYDSSDDHVRILVNWADHRSQCWVDLKFGDLRGKEVVLCDQIQYMNYIRDGVELMMRGLYLDVPAWHVHVFKCEIRERSQEPHLRNGDESALPDAEIFSKRFK